MSTRSLTDLRQLIDEIDVQLVGLLNERAELAIEIGKLKAAVAKEIYDPERERAVLERIDDLNRGPLSKGAIEEVYGCIITACREIQARPNDDIRR